MVWKGGFTVRWYEKKGKWPERHFPLDKFPVPLYYEGNRRAPWSPFSETFFCARPGEVDGLTTVSRFFLLSRRWYE